MCLGQSEIGKIFNRVFSLHFAVRFFAKMGNQPGSQHSASMTSTSSSMDGPVQVLRPRNVSQRPRMMQKAASLDTEDSSPKIHVPVQKRQTLPAVPIPSITTTDGDAIDGEGHANKGRRMSEGQSRHHHSSLMSPDQPAPPISPSLQRINLALKGEQTQKAGQKVNTVSLISVSKRKFYVLTHHSFIVYS